jgi:hypothetical protein
MLNINASSRRKAVIFIFSLISLSFCILQIVLPPPFGMMDTAANILLATSSSPHSKGCQQGLTKCICPRQTVCADDKVSMVLLAIARCSVFFDYPLYMSLFLTKARNLNHFMQRTILSEWINFTDIHSIHELFGVIVGIETMFHSFFHLLRWGLRDQDIKVR